MLRRGGDSGLLLPCNSLALKTKTDVHTSYLVTSTQKNGHMEHPTKARVLMRFLFSLFRDSLHLWKVSRNHGACFTEVTFFCLVCTNPLKWQGLLTSLTFYIHSIHCNEFLQIYRKIGPQKEGKKKKETLQFHCYIHIYHPGGVGIFKLSLWLNF